MQSYTSQRKSLDQGSRSLEQKVEILKDTNDLCEWIIALFSFIISKQKIDKVIPVVASKFEKK